MSVFQKRIEDAARAPARKDLNEAFPLRGFVTCSDCNNPLTSCFSKSKTGAKHPHYMCFTKGCDSYRKSIKRADIEGEFEVLLHQLTPSDKLLNYLTIIFKREWELCRSQLDDMKKALKCDIVQIDRQIGNMLDKIADEMTTPQVLFAPPKQPRDGTMVIANEQQIGENVPVRKSVHPEQNYRIDLWFADDSRIERELAFIDDLSWLFSAISVHAESSTGRSSHFARVRG